MAITRAQQAKQMLRKGGRIGFRIGSDEGDVSGREYDRPSTTKQSTFDSEVEDQTSSDDRREVQLTGGDQGSGLARKRKENIKKIKTFKDTRPDVKTPPLGVLSFFKKPLQKFSDFTTARNRAFFENVIRAGKIPGLNFATLDDLTSEELEEKYQDYMSERLAGNIDAYGNPLMRGDDGPDPIPFIPKPIEEPVEEVAEYVNPLSKLTTRIAGSRFLGTEFAADGGRIGAMNGGIMNVENLDREAFLLGGIAKGLKKAVRGVKKLVKSPIGKAAILGAIGFGIPGVQSGFFSKGLMGTQKGIALKNLFMGKPLPFKTAGDAVARSGGILNFLKSPMGLITGTSLAAGLMTPKQDENDDFMKNYYNMRLEPSQSVRGMGSEFDFYGGERMRVADGGDVEPVAKKTMPLIDMDGKEKDYRETGGFVDMGRMERADDVPARLSKNEFVFTADAVRNAGEGDIDKGAEVMYNMMKNLEAGGEVSEESQGLEGAREMFQTSQRLGEVI